MNLHSIRWRIAGGVILLIVATIVGLGIYLSILMRNSYIDTLDDQLAREARLIADSLPIPLEKADPKSSLLDDSAKRWAASLGMRVTLIAADGVVLGESNEDRTKMDNHSTRPEIIQAQGQGQGNSIRFSKTVGYNMLYTAIKVVDQGQTSGYVRLSIPLEQVDAHIRQLYQALITAALVAVVLAVILATVLAGGTTRSLRALTQAAQRLAGADQEPFPLSTHLDETERLTQAFSIMSERLQQQFNVLEVERSKLSAVLEEMTDGVLIVDSGGVIQLVNAAAARMFDVNPAAAQGDTLAEAIRLHQPVELWQRCRDTGEMQTGAMEAGIRRLYLQAIATPLGKALPGSILLLFQDQTRQRQFEVARRDFLSNISHDLRTPLASLKALTETLQEGGVLKERKTAKHFLQRIETEVDALSLLVTELLELSRIESGRVPVQLKPVHPLNILVPAVDRLRLQAERAHIQLTLECPENLPLVQADAIRIQQVVVNLLHNAIKFTMPGGKIEVGAFLPGSDGDLKKIEVPPGSGGQMVIFYCKDTGVGIPAQELPRIFERFYKIDKSRATSGTGLGLAIAHQLVESHQGKIWVESSEGKGSTFSFSIPVVK